MTRLAIAALAAAAAAMTIGISPAVAGPLPAGGVTRAEIVDWLERKGFEADLHPAKDGEMIVSSTVSGVNYDIFFYDCRRERCGAISYQAGWTSTPDVTVEEINGWNARKRFVFGYHRDSDDSVWMEYDVELSPGGSWELLEASFSRWEDQAGAFKAFIDRGGAPE